MNILICTYYFNQTHNGAAQFARQFYKLNQNQKIHKVAVLSPDIDLQQATDHQHFFSLNLTSTRAIPGLELLTIGKKFVTRAKIIKREFNFDVLFFNNVTLGKYAKKQFPNTKIVGFIHDDNYLSYSFQNFKFSKKWAYRMLQKRIEQSAIQQMDILLTNSKYMQGLIHQQYQPSHLKVAQVYVAINQKGFSKKRKVELTCGNKIKILFVKNEYQRGGLSDLITATEQLNLKRKISITVVGPFLSEKAAIQKMFKFKKAKLNFVGNIPQTELFNLMYEHHVLCIPSRQEAQGLCVIEGMANGIPVITTDAGGLKEMTTDGTYAWVAKAGDVSSLRNQFNSFLNLTEMERQQKALSAQQFTTLNFSLKSMHQTLINSLNDDFLGSQDNHM